MAAYAMASKQVARRTFAQEELPLTPVENPILCGPYQEPTAHWYYSKANGSMERTPGRRPASFFADLETAEQSHDQIALFEQEGAARLKIADSLREDVRRWRETKWEGATEVTKTLLRHWTDSNRARPLFFCQLEAVETLIYLNEVRGIEKGVRVCRHRFKPKFEDKDFAHLLDLPNEADLKPLVRYCTKMCTGSGKTVVMAMTIAWAACNRGKVASDERFPRAALVICPNLTVKERLQVLRPEIRGNYYEEFDIVPMSLRPLLKGGRVLVMNWHGFKPEGPHTENGKSHVVVNKGAESNEAFAKRILGDLADLGPLLVLNDEAHHAYRPAVIVNEELSAEEKAEREEATLWIAGLDKLNAVGRVRFCGDLSATPFYIHGSGYRQGEPFRWIVSDFGLLDGIESGIVKIPRLPVASSSGRPDPEYFRLWDHVLSQLQPADFLGTSHRRRPKPEAVWRVAEPALQTLAGQWKERFDYIQKATDAQEKIPPVLIIVCDNTELAEVFYRNISGERENDTADTTDDLEDTESDEHSTEESSEEAKPVRGASKKITVYGQGSMFPEYFSNTSNVKRTFRIDSKMLEKAESEDPTVKRTDAAQAMRRIIATVGKPGEPGEQIRCVVSVSMLTEGWDANNVTHIFGLRPFESQLLCEQVVGRGLRRMNYTVDPETGKLTEEYVDIYGIPFSVIPFKGRAANAPAPNDKPKQHVRALEERKALEIRFPIVEGYAFASQPTVVSAEVARIEMLEIEPNRVPTEVLVRPHVGIEPGFPSLVGPGETEKHDRTAFYEEFHAQTIAFDIARSIVERMTEAGGKLKAYSRHILFPQVLRITMEYIETRIKRNGQDLRELALEKYRDRVVSLLCTAINPIDEQNEPALVPILNRYQPFGTSSEVNFLTTRPCMDTLRSHVNQVVLDTDTWERAVAFVLESHSQVRCYVRNDHLGFSIPYEYDGIAHAYFPDFLIRLADGRMVILEVKGYMTDVVSVKTEAAKRWIRAVNHSDKLGRWHHHVNENPQLMAGELDFIAALDF